MSREIDRIIPVAQDTIDRLGKGLRRGNEEALAEVRRLRDEAVELGIEVGRYEEILQVNKWLNELLSLVQGEEGVEGKRVRAIALSVVRGIAIWLKRQDNYSLPFTSLLSTTERLISQLEQWKV